MRRKSIIIFALILIFVIAPLIWGYLVVKDAIEFKEKLGTSKNLILLSSKGTFLAGFEITPDTKSLVFLNSTELTKLQQSKIEEYHDSYYKIIVFDESALQDLPEKLEFDNQTFEKEFFINLLLSPDPIDYYIKNKLGIEKNSADYFSAYKRIQSETTQDMTQLKSMLFAQGILYLFEKNEMYIFYAIKTGKAKVYPETPLFKTLKFIPKGFLDFLAEKI